VKAGRCVQESGSCLGGALGVPVCDGVSQGFAADFARHFATRGERCTNLSGHREPMHDYATASANSVATDVPRFSISVASVTMDRSTVARRAVRRLAPIRAERPIVVISRAAKGAGSRLPPVSVPRPKESDGSGPQEFASSGTLCVGDALTATMSVGPRAPVGSAPHGPTESDNQPNPLATRFW